MGDQRFLRSTYVIHGSLLITSMREGAHVAQLARLCLLKVPADGRLVLQVHVLVSIRATRRVVVPIAFVSIVHRCVVSVCSVAVFVGFGCLVDGRLRAVVSVVGLATVFLDLSLLIDADAWSGGSTCDGALPFGQVRVACSVGPFIILIRAIDLIQTDRAAAEIRLTVLVAFQEVAHVGGHGHAVRGNSLL